MTTATEFEIYFKGCFCTSVSTVSEFKSFVKDAYKHNESLLSDEYASYLLKDENGTWMLLMYKSKGKFVINKF